MLKEINVVSRDEIRAIYSIEQDGITHHVGELRSFEWHEQLKNFLPPASAFSIAWVKLKAGERLEPHVHDIQSMIIIHEGSGQMLGQKPQEIKAGDIIVVPPGCAHGFVGGTNGFRAFSVQFGQGLYNDPQQARVNFVEDSFTLERLLAYNQERLQQFIQKPMFKILQDGTLQDAKKRQRFLNSLKIWVDGNQALLLARQATCVDEAFRPLFLQHLQEEIGHDVLFNKRQEVPIGETPVINDPIMRAITDWFTHQMFILDNVEKAAIIHLMIENASVNYHRIAKPCLEKYVNTEYFDVHIEADSEHAAMGVKMLQNQSPAVYARLRKILAQAWDMLGAMTDRVVELTLEQSGNTVKQAEEVVS